MSQFQSGLVEVLPWRWSKQKLSYIIMMLKAKAKSMDTNNKTQTFDQRSYTVATWLKKTNEDDILCLWTILSVKISFNPSLAV